MLTPGATRRIAHLRNVSPKGASATARKCVRRQAAPGVDPLVAKLAVILARETGHLNDIHKRAGVDRRVSQRWLTGDTVPNISLLRAVLEACGYDLQIVRKREGEP